MKKVREALRGLEHHHKVKIVVTTGCVMQVLAALVPEAQVFYHVITLATNAIWIWE